MPLYLFNAIRTHRWPAGPCYKGNEPRIYPKIEDNLRKKHKNVKDANIRNVIFCNIFVSEKNDFIFILDMKFYYSKYLQIKELYDKVQYLFL